ncbi:MAG TPA: hypothetical protein VGL65_13750 [Gemmatimonadales bacterium]|jgi:hypothetical protein
MTTGAPAPDDRPEFSPVGPDAPKEDRISTALLAMGAAAAASCVWFAVLTLIQSYARERSTARSAAQVDPHSADVNFVVYGLVLGLGFTAVTAWLLLAPIPSSYRRGALAMVAGLGGTSLAMVATWILYGVAGRPALAALGVVSVAIAVWLAWRSAVSAR